MDGLAGTASRKVPGTALPGRLTTVEVGCVIVVVSLRKSEAAGLLPPAPSCTLRRPLCAIPEYPKQRCCAPTGIAGNAAQRRTLTGSFAVSDQARRMGACGRTDTVAVPTRWLGTCRQACSQVELLQAQELRLGRLTRMRLRPRDVVSRSPRRANRRASDNARQWCGVSTSDRVAAEWAIQVVARCGRDDPRGVRTDDRVELSG